MISGAQLRINGLNFGSDSRVVLPHNNDKIASYSLPDVSFLKDFVANYDSSIAQLRIRNLIPIEELSNAATLWQEVETEIRSLCLAKVDLDTNDLEPEPGFILGLRALTNTLGRLWAERF
jgi:hypothetical protein